MTCPSCQSTKNDCVDSRPSGNETRRRRRCHQCSTLFTTYEVSEEQMRFIQSEPDALAELRTTVAGAIVELTTALKTRKPDSRFRSKQL